MTRTLGNTKGTGGGATTLTGDVTGSGSGTVATTVPDLHGVKKIGNLIVVGHSYTAGATQTDAGVPNIYQQGMISKLQAMLGIHEQNITHLGMAGSAITQPTMVNFTNIAFGGWAGALALLYPNNSASMNAAGDVVETDNTAPAVGAGVIVHSVNDYALGMTNAVLTSPDGLQADINAKAGREAYRAVISRMRAGVVFTAQAVAGTPTWDNTTSFSSAWNGSVVQITGNSGAALRTSSISGEKITFNIPTNFEGGVAAVTFIGQFGGMSYLTSNMGTTDSVMQLNDRTQLPIVPASSIANYVLQVENEYMLVSSFLSSAAGAVKYKVTRSIAGTTAANHSGTGVFATAAWVPSALSYIQWSGTATGSLMGTSSTIASGNGRTYIGGKGTIGNPVPVTQRFDLDPSDAGKTIIATFNRNALETGMTAQYDSWHLESNTPPPIVVANGVDFRNGYYYYNISGSYGYPTNLSYIQYWNNMIPSVISEFDDYVKLADVYTPWYDRNGVLQADAPYGYGGATVTTTNTTLTDTLQNWQTNAVSSALVYCNGKYGGVTANTASQLTVSSWSGGGNPGNGASFYGMQAPFTANTSTFVPSVGAGMTGGGGYGAEIMIITSVAGTSPNLILNFSRGGRNTSVASYGQTAFFKTRWFGSTDWMHTDMIHPNAVGHSIFAEELYRGFQSIQSMGMYQVAQSAGNWSQGSQSFSMGIIDNNYIYPPTGSIVGTAGVQNTLYASPVYVPKLSILTGMGVRTLSNMGAGGVIRFGIFMPDGTHSRPLRLVQDFGTQPATTAGLIQKTGLYQVLRPGWYWLAVVQQVGTACNWECMNSLLFPSLSSATALGAGTQNPTGYSRTGMSSVLTDWTTGGFTNTTSDMPRLFIQLRAPQF